MSKEVMCDHICAMVDARIDKNFMIIARTDALWLKNDWEETIDRCNAYLEAGADACFITFAGSIKELKEYRNRINGPVVTTAIHLRILLRRKQKPELKVLLSIGGWGSGRFSEMAANDEYRRAFAADCDRVVKEFALDGIDIDWEYPTSSMANISSSPDDTENFTLLMQDIRAAIGNEKELTLAPKTTLRYSFGNESNFVLCNYKKIYEHTSGSSF